MPANPGAGPAGAGILLREVQETSPAAAPHVGERTFEGARRAGLPADHAGLAGLPAQSGHPALLAAPLLRFPSPATPSPT
jgi:hypothetical protein